MSIEEAIQSKAESQSQSSAIHQKSSIVPLIIVAAMFFILGFVTWLNGSLMPFLELVLQLSPLEATFIIFSFYIAVTFTALPSSWIIGKIGYKNGMALGLFIMAGAALMFIPAAQTQYFGLFLFAQLVMGSGQTLLQTAVNPYVVKCGPEESAARRISICGIMNKGAGVIAPAIFVWLVMSDLGDVTQIKPTPEALTALSNELILPYLYLTALVAIFALAIKFSPLPELKEDEEDIFEEGDEGVVKQSAFAFPHLIFGVVAIFLYVAIEVIAGDTIGSYGKELGMQNFAGLTSYALGFLVVGYILNIIFIPRFISQQAYLSFSAAIGILLALAIMFGDNQSTAISDVILAPFGLGTLPNPIMCIALMGLVNAIVWPAVWPLALNGLGKFTRSGSALLIMGIAGGAVGPVMWGGLASIEDIGRQGAYVVLIPAYAFILFYALKGHKMRSWKKKS